MANTREELTAKIERIKREKKLSWKKICAAIGKGSPIYYTAALLGQMKLSEAEAKKAGKVLGLNENDILLLQEIPYRGSLPPGPPTDPTIYRFYEVLQVYGPTIKELIHEEFGDGIMSAINFRLSVDRVPDPAGDRVVVTLNGKFLPYQW